jgi:penicillin-binding protein 1A
MHVQIEACPYSGKPPTPYCPVDHRVKASAILLPKDSPYRKLSDKDLEKYLPGAVKDLDRLASLDYNNPNDRPFFCPIHTEEWYKGESDRESITNEAYALIAQVKSNMTNPKYVPKLTQKDIDKLNQAIAKLEEVLKQGIIDIPEKPIKDKDKIKDLPIFDASLVEKEMKNLEKLNKDIFSAIEKQLEKEKPDPEPVDPDPPNGNNDDHPPNNGNGNNDNGNNNGEE